MTALTAIATIGSIFGLGALTAWVLAGTSQRREFRRLRERVAGTPPSRHRRRVMDGFDWYLQGCAAARAGEMRNAARNFGMAHHADWRLQSAALLTFSALKTADGNETKLLDQLVQTWHEMKEPEILSQRVDRALIDTMTEQDPAPSRCSDLGRLAWIVSSPAHRQRLEQLLLESPTWSRPLFNDAN